MTQPCIDWPVIWPVSTVVGTSSPTVTGYAVKASTSILWAATGRRYDTCTVTIRPSPESLCLPSDWPWPYDGWPYSTDPLCWCSLSHDLVLTEPAQSIVEVKVDGAPLVTGAYKLYDNRYLVRADGQTWPTTNDFTKNDTEVGTWSVTVTYGEPVPTLGQLANGELAAEIIRSLNGEDCRIPQSIQSLTRQGVTITYPDVAMVLASGQLGLFLCDHFINTVNPHHLRRRSGVYNVDVSPPRRLT